LTLLSTALGGRLGRLPARTTETLLIYPRFPRFAQLIPAAAPARNGAGEPFLRKISLAVRPSAHLRRRWLSFSFPLCMMKYNEMPF
jgi:hypothetical protein